MNVAVIGLGAMGLPMASRLASSGFSVFGYDPSPQRIELAAKAGVQTTTTVEAAAAKCEAVLFAVRDQAQAEEALFGAGGAAAALSTDTTVMLTSTLGAHAVVSLATSLHETGAAVIDAPVSGGSARAAKGDLLMMVAGAPEHVERVRSVLECLASSLAVVGSELGQAQVLKVINQLLAGVHIAVAAEAIAVASKLGLDPSLVVDVLGGGAANSFMLQDRGPRMLTALTAEPAVKSRVDIFVKDMGLVSRLAEEAGVPTPVAAAANQTYLLAAQAGLSARDDSTIVTLLTKAARA